MKAWELQNGFGFDALKQVDRPDPRPGPGQVLLRMQAWSLNYRDLMVIKGQYNPRLKFPQVPLSDGVGEIIEIGPGVANLKVGERVAGCFMPGWGEGLLRCQGPHSFGRRRSRCPGGACRFASRRRGPRPRTP
jgi:NADPH:quinone reductase-like Zn-dependent oxidoreductase